MILASAQVYPELWQQVLAAVQRGDLATARSLQMSVQKLSRIFCRHGGGVAVKQALKIMGLDVGKPRRPLKAVGGALLHEDRAEIQLELERLGKAQAKEGHRTAVPGDLTDRFDAIGLSSHVIREAGLRVGSGSAGDGAERVSIDLVAGRTDGPVGDAYAYQLTYPRHGYEALTAILEPNLTLRPPTLIVPANSLRDLREANMVYGPGQTAVSRAVVDKLEDGTIPESAVEEELMIVQATIEPGALDRHTLAGNVHRATAAAIAQAFGRS